jgi:hypothetical protein
MNLVSPGGIAGTFGKSIASTPCSDFVLFVLATLFWSPCGLNDELMVIPVDRRLFVDTDATPSALRTGRITTSSSLELGVRMLPSAFESFGLGNSWTVGMNDGTVLSLARVE